MFKTLARAVLLALLTLAASGSAHAGIFHHQQHKNPNYHYHKPHRYHRHRTAGIFHHQQHSNPNYHYHKPHHHKPRKQRKH